MRELHRTSEKALIAGDRLNDPCVQGRRAPDHEAIDPWTGSGTQQPADAQIWRRVLSGFVTFTTLAVAIALGAIYLLVSQGA